MTNVEMMNTKTEDNVNSEQIMQKYFAELKQDFIRMNIELNMC